MPLSTNAPGIYQVDWKTVSVVGLVILVMSCSCALVISVPTAVIAAISRGARDGILIGA